MSMETHRSNCHQSPSSSKHLHSSELLGSSGLGLAEKEGTLCNKDFGGFRSFHGSGAVFIGMVPAWE